MDLLQDLEDLGSDYSQEQDQEQELEEQPDDLSQLTTHFNSRELQQTLSKIEQFSSNPREYLNALEEDIEYSTIVDANSSSFELEFEFQRVVQYVKNHYQKRFPELDSLISSPIDYIKTVLILQNDLEAKIGNLDHLSAATAMVVNVTATTAKGTRLDDTELNAVVTGCELALEIESCKNRLLEYVESRMKFLAPNLSKILSSKIAAKMVGVAGGLQALSRIPSCNYLILGQVKQATMGLSTVWLGKNRGVIYQTDLVANVPFDMQRKAARIVAGKSSLAARVDACRESPNGEIGQQFLEQVQKNIGLLLQPIAQRKTKALPVPIEQSKKRRGGKRARKLKERMGITEIRKAQNRMAFGEQEQEVVYGDEVVGLGMVGSGSGRIRAFKEKKMKIPLSKKYQQTLSNMNNNVSGLASSVAFTPIKGIEMINPEPISLPKQDKYFGASFKAPIKKD